MNLREWITEYYTTFRAPELKHTTIRSYLSFLSNVPEEWNVEDVTLHDVQKLVNELAGRLSASSVKHTFQIIKEALDNADIIGLPVKYRYYNRVKLPKMRKKIVHALSDEELGKLLKEIYNSDYADVYIVLLNTGLRFCELAGLNNESFSPADMSFKVTQRFYRGAIEDGCKTDSGVRLLPVTKSLNNIFMRHFAFYQPNLPLFCSKKNERLSYNTILHDWHKVCKRANLEPFGLHVLRHTYASRLLNAGVSLKVVSALLGHKSISITADIYCDVSLSSKRAALSQLQSFEQNENRASVL